MRISTFLLLTLLAALPAPAAPAAPAKLMVNPDALMEKDPSTPPIPPPARKAEAADTRRLPSPPPPPAPDDAEKPPAGLLFDPSGPRAEDHTRPADAEIDTRPDPPLDSPNRPDHPFSEKRPPSEEKRRFKRSRPDGKAATTGGDSLIPGDTPSEPATRSGDGGERPLRRPNDGPLPPRPGEGTAPHEFGLPDPSDPPRPRFEDPFSRGNREKSDLLVADPSRRLALPELPALDPPLLPGEERDRPPLDMVDRPPRRPGELPPFPDLEFPEPPEQPDSSDLDSALPGDETKDKPSARLKRRTPTADFPFPPTVPPLEKPVLPDKPAIPERPTLPDLPRGDKPAPPERPQPPSLPEPPTGDRPKLPERPVIPEKPTLEKPALPERPVTPEMPALERPQRPELPPLPERPAPLEKPAFPERPPLPPIPGR